MENMLHTTNTDRQSTPKVFWFHYHKQKSKVAGRNILSVHYKGQCHFVEEIECFVPVKTKSRKTQPHCVLYGRGIVNFVDNKAVIT